MSFLYNFGLSQDDAQTERRALELRPGDRLLCIASAGEVPLNLLATTSARIDAVDISPEQLSLCRLKLAAARWLDPPDAARFLGYLPATEEERRTQYQHIEPHLPQGDRAFWSRYPNIFRTGAIHWGRFERYLTRFRWLGLRILNKKKVMGLFECDDVAQQRRYFDRHLDTRALQGLFSIVFHPRIYRKRGMDQAALLHAGKRDIARFFFSKFRDFCTATLARRNYFLQFILFNQILFPEALPEYLTEAGNRQLRRGFERLRFYHTSLSGRLREQPAGTYNKFALSNVGDWLTADGFATLMELLVARAEKPARALLRYIHYAHPLPNQLRSNIRAEPELGERLEETDRFPFYNLIPMSISRGEPSGR